MADDKKSKNDDELFKANEGAAKGAAAGAGPEARVGAQDESKTQYDDAHDELQAAKADRAREQEKRPMSDTDNPEEKAARGAAAGKNPGDPGRKARKVGPPKGEAVAMDPAELIEQIRDADEVEVVFSDGVNEITGLPPVPITGDNPWRITGAGLLLQNTDITLHGPGFGATAYQIAGYGLFLDGEQVAYRARPDVVNVGVNMTVRLENDVVF